MQLLIEIDDRLHVMIYDADEEVYQVPESVLPRPDSHGDQYANHNIRFDFQPDPFSFRVLRDADGEEQVLFDTTDTNIVFESQYLNLRTWLPDEPNLYGLGEHTDSLRLPTHNYTRTLWNRDAYSIPSNTNLYGDHPVYVDHRGDAGTHGVFFLNSNGMDIKIDSDGSGRKFLEYNTIGGVLDFYFLAGPTPKEVSKQYAEVVGLPAMQSYWTFGVCATRPQPRIQADIYSSTTVATDTGMFTLLQKPSTTTVKLESLWRLCGLTLTTWMVVGCSLWTLSDSPWRRCVSWLLTCTVTTRSTLLWLIRPSVTAVRTGIFPAGAKLTEPEQTTVPSTGAMTKACSSTEMRTLSTAVCHIHANHSRSLR